MKKKLKYKKAQTGSFVGSDNFAWSDLTQNAPISNPYDDGSFFRIPGGGTPAVSSMPDLVKKSFAPKPLYNPLLADDINYGLSGLDAIGGIINNNRQRRDEQDQVLRSITPAYVDNFEDQGLNNIPAYTKAGGKIKPIYPYGGGPLTSKGAKEILRDGTVRGKKLTSKQKRYFGYIAGGGKPKAQTGTTVLLDRNAARDYYWNPHSNDATQQPSYQEIKAAKHSAGDVYDQMDKLYFTASNNFTNKRAELNPSINPNGTLKLTSGKFKGASINPDIIKGLVKAAKNQNIDPWELIGLAGQESTFGKAYAGSTTGITSLDNIVSGWNVYDNNKPYEYNRFLADNKVPGISVDKDKDGEGYYATDDTTARTYVNLHPELLDKYKQKLASIQPPTVNAYEAAAQRLKKSGIKGYNPGDPNYTTDVQNSIKLLKSDPALSKYVSTMKTGGKVKFIRKQVGGQGDQIQQIMQQCAQELQQGKQPQQIMQELVQSGIPQQQAQQIIQQVIQQLQQSQGQQQSQGDEQEQSGQQEEQPDQAKAGKWIPSNLHKGRCANPGSADCPKGSPQYNLAMTFKKYHGFHQAGGNNIPTTEGLPDNMSQMANVNAEEGEIFQTNDGGISKVADDAGTHAEGGADLANVDRVLEDTSDKRKDFASRVLKMSPDNVEALTGYRPKRPVTHSKAFEFVTDKINAFRRKVSTGNKKLNSRANFDKYAYNAATLNLTTMNSLPSNDDVFDTLFNHQEDVKKTYGIKDDGTMIAKYGIKAQTGTGVTTYPGGKESTPAGNSNAFDFPGGLDAFKQAWSPFVNLDSYGNVSDAQSATYNWLVQNKPDLATSIWNEGLTKKGLSLLNDPSASSTYKAAATKLFDASGKLKTGVTPSADDLAALAPAYADNMLGVRTIAPAVNTQSETTPVPTEEEQFSGLPSIPNTDVTGNFSPIQQPNNTFHEATHWYDNAPGIFSLIDAMTREPELYNPVQFHQLKSKLIDPTSQLNANQSDYNTAANAIRSQRFGSGFTAANIANLASKKYQINNEVLSNAENANNQIKNNEIAYNTNVRDKQSAADADTRGSYYNRVLLGRENQRLQKLQSIQALSRVAALKARQNRSGNLVLKLSPAFDQNGNYNGYRYVPVIPGEDQISEVPVAQTKTATSKPYSKTTVTWKKGDKLIKQETKN